MQASLHGALCGNSVQGMQIGKGPFLAEVMTDHLLEVALETSDGVLATSSCKDAHSGDWKVAGVDNKAWEKCVGAALSRLSCRVCAVVPGLRRAHNRGEHGTCRTWVEAPLNHFDITCRNGDVNIDPRDSANPCLWYVDMAK